MHAPCWATAPCRLDTPGFHLVKRRWEFVVAVVPGGVFVVVGVVGEAAVEDTDESVAQGA
jgi:hypothetical protein